MSVTLLTCTGDPERMIAAAARLCYSASDVDSLLHNLTPEKSADFVGMLAEIGHESPIEHASFTFAIEGVSRAFLAQITRHRIASYSVQSQRYVSKKQFEYITPPAISADPQAKERFDLAMRQAQEAYDELAAILTDTHEQELIDQGVDAKEARKRASKTAMEDARFVLPNACDTRMIVTMNARSLLNFFRHRCCRRAQWEIRAVADEMLGLCFEAAPTLFAHAGPPCVRGACPEGKMTCGAPEEVRAHIRDLKGKGGGL